MTSVAKVEQVLLPVPPASPPARRSRVPTPPEPSGWLKAPGRPGSTGPLGGKGGGGLPGSAQVSAASRPPAGRAFALRTHRPWCQNFRSASPQLTEGLARLLSLPHPDPAAHCPRAVPRSLHLTTPNPCRPRSRSLPPSLLCAPEKFGPSSRAWSPALTRDERSRSGRHAGAEGGGGRRRERRAPHSGPCCPCRRLSCKRGGGRRRVTCPLSHPAA